MAGRLGLAAEGGPNVLVIFTDDVGISNVSAYHRGLMSNRTPNIDSIAEQGMLFTGEKGTTWA